MTNDTRSMSERDTFTGTDWTTSLLRPGCQDHEKYGSRRGDEVVPFMRPQAQCVGKLKDTRPLALEG